tara:strand:+ start:999 stop:2711 length:1713 start_codon:yes stop_codon:yes gene_type:complete
MSVFNRQLFNGGGEVLAVENTLSQTNPEEFTYTLEYVEGKPFARKKQTQGFLSREDELIPINTDLSASGNPREAFDVMRKNALLDAAKTTALTGVGIASLPRTLVSGAISRAAPYVASVGSFANKFFNPVKTSLKPGVAVPGLKGFQARDRLNPMSYQITGANPAGLFFTGSGGTILGTQAAQTTAEDVAQSEEGQKIAAEIKELERQSGITGRTSYEAAIKSAIESGDKDQVRILRDKMKELYGEDSPLAEEFLKDPKPESENKEQKQEQDPKEINQPQPEQERPAEPTEEKEVPLLQNKNFLDLMRNIGIKMVETGDLGRGISLGSAEALKEGRAERLVEEERQAELDKIAVEYGLDLRNARDKAYAESLYDNTFGEFLAKEQFKNKNELMNNIEYSEALSENVLKTETADVMLNYLKKAKALIENEDVTGAVPVAKEGLNKIARFFGYEVPQNPREQAKAFLNFVAKADVKELLGESGRTISNIDRTIAEELVGRLTAFTGKEDILAQLNKSIAKYEDAYNKNLRNYEARTAQYRKFGLAPPFQLGKSIQESRGQPIAEIKMSDYVQ